MSEETIVAISTPPGSGGIGLIRLSGPQSLRIGRSLFLASPPLGHRPRFVEWGRVRAAGRDIDTGLAWYLRAPRSYTGEDTVEISCHGSTLVLECVVDEAIRQGARLAEPGEFTRRAFLNGRLDLLQAEAVIDLIQAGSEASLESAYGLAGGRLSRLIHQFKKELVEVMARIEVGLDFSEEDIDPIPRREMGERLRQLVSRAEELVQTFVAGSRRQQGYLIALIGRPNVGKSTLLNTLLGEDRAIVTPVPGTTRDLVEGRTTWKGRAFRLVDTAGMRESEDPIEREGVERALEVARRADIVLVVLDASRPWTEEDEELRSFAEDKDCIVVLNKVDLPRRLESDKLPTSAGLVVEISALTGMGRKDLIEAIDRVLPRDLEVDGVVLTRQRHREGIERMAAKARIASQMIEAGEPEECIAAELREGVQALEELLGDHVDEEVLDAIFSEFCIGK